MFFLFYHYLFMIPILPPVFFCLLNSYISFLFFFAEPVTFLRALTFRVLNSAPLRGVPLHRQLVTSLGRTAKQGEEGRPEKVRLKRPARVAFASSLPAFLPR